MAFSMGQQPLAIGSGFLKYPDLIEAEVYFIYDVMDPTQFFTLLEKGLDLCFIFSNQNRASVFLQTKGASFVLQNRKVSVYLLGSYEEEYKLIGWRYLFMKRAHLIASGGPFEIRDRLENMIGSIELVASDYREFGFDVLSNIYSNLKLLNRVIFPDELKKYFPNKPVMVCGAGPSLCRHLDDLRSLYNNILILGCGSAIPILINGGIRPHMVAFIDPDPPIAPFEKIENFDMPLLYQGRVSSNIFKLHKGPKIWMGNSEGYLIEKWLDSELGFPDYFFDGGWNVANFGIRAMQELGASSIYFLGLDSCYEKEVIGSSEWVVEDIHGQSRVTRKDLFMGAKWITSFANEHPDIKIINVAEEGLRIDGVENERLTSLQEKLSQWNPSETLNSIFSQIKEYVVDHDRCLELLEMIRNSLLRSKEIVHECLKMVQKHNTNAAFALFDVEIKDELAHKFLLEPLWNVWKHIVLRDANLTSISQEPSEKSPKIFPQIFANSCEDIISIHKASSSLQKDVDTDRVEFSSFYEKFGLAAKLQEVLFFQEVLQKHL
jgi:uncharacterized Rossmann fold enzyme